MRQKVRNVVLVILFIGCSFVFTGCSETELQERCFPMLAAVGYEDGNVVYDAVFPRTGASGQDKNSIGKVKAPQVKTKNFEKCMEEYEGHLNKQVDYNHLKVVVIEEDLIEENALFQQMLDELAKTERFPRNTYVCAVDNVEDLFGLEEELSQDLGTYLEEYINKHEEGKSHILTLGDLLDEKENQTMILYMPYLKAEDKYIEWGGYVNILGEMWQDF